MRVPILKIKNLLLTSIQIDLDDQELADFRADMLDKVQNTEAKGAVIDISALDVVDSYMARIISETAHMIGLLGCRVVVCGMQPSVALTLVEMGRELVGVETALNLEHGLEKLFGTMGLVSMFQPDSDDETDDRTIQGSSR
ncbi:MAG: STAS domain-containing protein [Candidatus Thiodiazotropha sp.]